MRAALPIAIFAVLLLASMPYAVAGEDETYLVTLAAGTDPAAVAKAHRAQVVAAGADVAVLEGGSAKAIARDPRVLSVELDGVVRASSSGWDSATWDGATWDGATWDGATWDGATWDGATWDGATWDGATWDGATWDGATWDGATWDGATWDGATWDGATWDGATWDGATWDGATWDGATWDGNTPRGTRIPWMLAAIDAPAAWRNGLAQAARTVCVVDTGVDATHPLLARRVWRDATGSHGLDLVDDDTDPSDVSGHGTHLAGIVAATPGPHGVRGVGAPLVASARVLGPAGTGATSDVIAALGWCGDIGADIVLLALTEDTPTRALRHAVNAAQARGMLLVASAGNAGPCRGCVSFPGAYPGVIAVGAIAPNGSVAPFSSTGPQVSLLAPGVDVVSTYPGGQHRLGSGTSQAAAVVAGVAALVWGQAPDLDAKEISKVLSKTARPSQDLGKSPGLVNAGAASSTVVG